MVYRDVCKLLRKVDSYSATAGTDRLIVLSVFTFYSITVNRKLWVKYKIEIGPDCRFFPYYL